MRKGAGQEGKVVRGARGDHLSEGRGREVRTRHLSAEGGRAHHCLPASRPVCVGQRRGQSSVVRRRGAGRAVVRRDKHLAVCSVAALWAHNTDLGTNVHLGLGVSRVVGLHARGEEGIGEVPEGVRCVCAWGQSLDHRLSCPLHHRDGRHQRERSETDLNRHGATWWGSSGRGRCGNGEFGSDACVQVAAGHRAGSSEVALRNLALTVPAAEVLQGRVRALSGVLRRAVNRVAADRKRSPLHVTQGHEGLDVTRRHGLSVGDHSVVVSIGNTGHKERRATGTLPAVTHEVGREGALLGLAGAALVEENVRVACVRAGGAGETHGGALGEVLLGHLHQEALKEGRHVLEGRSRDVRPSGSVVRKVGRCDGEHVVLTFALAAHVEDVSGGRAFCEDSAHQGGEEQCFCGHCVVSNEAKKGILCGCGCGLVS